jgi:hypothetical protein
MTCFSAEADMGEPTLKMRRWWSQCINRREVASSIEESCMVFSILIFLSDNVESWFKTGGNMGSALWSGKVNMKIDTKEGERSIEMQGRTFVVDHSNDMRLGRRGLPAT